MCDIENPGAFFLYELVATQATKHNDIAVSSASISVPHLYLSYNNSHPQ